jgi:Skp family chaperone for outer membrane proteins
MAKILLGVSILLTLLTGILGFLTKGKVADLQETVKGAKQTAATASAKAAKAENDLKKVQDELTAANATVADREKEAAKQKGEVEDLSKKLAAATADVEAKTKALADIQKEMGKGPVPVDDTQLGPKMNELNARLNKTETELAEARQIQATLEQQKREADEKLQVVQRKVQEYQGPITRAGLTGKVLAYNPGWNFVVLNIGDQAGVKANTQMLVVRGGQRIATVRVTSVEPRTAIADVLPGSLARGQSLQPGDQVVYEGKH